MKISFTVLGPVTAVRDGTPVPLSGQRLLALLAALLLAANEPVPTERLIEWAWGEGRSTNPRATLQNAMFRLRHAVGDDVIETTPLGYQLRADATTLDLLAFDRLVTEATAADRAGDTALAADRLRQATRLWRPPLLANVDAPELRRHATALLTERLLAVHEEHARLCLRLGRHAEVAADLGELVEAYPFREPLAAHLMAALAGAGRRADALVTYENVRRTLREELGVQPGPALRSLHASILRADTQPDAPTDAPGPAPTSHLPACPGRLHGRAGQAAALDRWLAERDRPAVAAVVGPAGAGKTALAVSSARRWRAMFPDGTLYLDLDGYAARAPLQTGAALGRLLDALGAGPIPAGAAARAAQWRGLLADRRILLVLDNARNSEQVRPLLPGAASPGAVVVTSRDQLRGLVARDGARRIALDALDADAVRALLADATGQPAERLDRDQVAELAHRCAGLPLAVRIVAERLARTGGALGETLSRLRAPAFLAELSADDGTDTDLRTALSWSCRTLDDQTARGYHRLGGHPDGEWSLPVVAAVLHRSPDQARVLLDRLVAIHLVRPVGTQRYAMPALVRAHAREGCGLSSHTQPRPLPPGAWLASHGAAGSSERAGSAAGARLATFAAVPATSAVGEAHESR